MIIVARTKKDCKSLQQPRRALAFTRKVGKASGAEGLAAFLISEVGTLE